MPMVCWTVPTAMICQWKRPGNWARGPYTMLHTEMRTVEELSTVSTSTEHVVTYPVCLKCSVPHDGDWVG